MPPDSITPPTNIKSDDPPILHCTHPDCKSSQAERTFTGPGAKTAHRRHMDTHNKPYFCPVKGCRRNTEGFSRKDNRNNHIKSHDRTANPGTSQRIYPETTQTKISSMSAYNRAQRRTKKLTLRLIKQAIVSLLEEMELEEEVDSEEDVKSRTSESESVETGLSNTIS
ncbi:hypothetical protein BZA77DRAFT_291572 [Pyronema omphalodes]|nr:hypothetical protein BZA77DRAFT_291572 [Pyronema omphalodes]